MLFKWPKNVKKNVEDRLKTWPFFVFSCHFLVVPIIFLPSFGHFLYFLTIFWPFFGYFFHFFFVFMIFKTHVFLLYSTCFDCLMVIFTYLASGHIFKKLSFLTMVETHDLHVLDTLISIGQNQ